MPWGPRPFSKETLKSIRLLVMDVDGVLTKGEIGILGDGTELRQFHSQEGVALMVAHQAGLETAIISGRDTPVVRQRAREVKIAHIILGTFVKLPPLEKLCQERNLSLSEVAYVGDDLPDIPPMRRVGWAVAVANAVPEVKKVAHYITERNGGEGAIREVVALILKAKGIWEKAVGEFIGDPHWADGFDG
ncbi:MAG: HAD hydrolase family protein [Armatimonadetes bacterium]|nr:HAD hydrolase family protein [Armatimonadota bacterium]MDW8121980.1 HAD hydrolase family protein [Armatimonadota bacterium]